MVIKRNASLTPSSLRRTHRGLVLSHIESDPGVSRSELARRHGFSEMAATRIVRELLSVGIVEEFDLAAQQSTKSKAVGRPRTGLRIVADSLYAVGITVSAYHSEVSICDASGHLFASTKFNDLPFNDATEAARFYATALHDLIATSKIGVDRIVGIGVALSARTSPNRGEIISSEYFGWGNDGGAFCREIRKIIDLPIEIENITNALAIAEMRFGVARNVADFTLIHAATFVGASVVSEGRVVRGDRDVSGLIGHLRTERRALICVCGRDDCLNLSATGFGLLAELGKLDHKTFDTSRVSYYASALLDVLADRKVEHKVQSAGANLAPAIDTIVKMLGPKMVIFSGDLGANDVYFEGLETAIKRDFNCGSDAPFDLVQGKISSVRSAALLALHAFCYSDQLNFERFAQIAVQQNGAHYA